MITYDEHGGFYDHVTPPAAPDDHPAFRRYGVRVPAFVISPWVAREQVSHEVFDHTSLLATILRRFCRGADGGVPDMGARVTQANDLGCLLAHPTPRPPTPLTAYCYLIDRAAHWQGDAFTHQVLSRATGKAPPRRHRTQVGGEERVFRRLRTPHRRAPSASISTLFAGREFSSMADEHARGGPLGHPVSSSDGGCFHPYRRSCAYLPTCYDGSPPTFDSGTANRAYQHRRQASGRLNRLVVTSMTRLGFAPDILAPGDLNTMGRLEAPPLSAAEEVAVFDRHLEPRIRRVSATATGPEYHGGEGQALDDLIASRGFEVVIRSARVIGYCGVGAYADVWARTAAGTPDRPSGTASGQASLRGAFAGYSNNVSTRCA